MNADKAAAAYGPAKGLIFGDQTTGVTVEYLDMTAYAGQWYRLSAIGADLYIVWVEDATPATTPTVTAVGTAAAMDIVFAGTSLERIIPGDPLRGINTFLAYATASGSGSFRLSVDGPGTDTESP